MSILSLLFTSLFTVFNLNPLAQAQSNQEPLRESAIAENISQLARSNTTHFWHFFANSCPNLREWKEVTGFVVGDPHPGNLNLGWQGGQVAYGVIDIDDSGAGSQLGDFVRWLVSIKAITREVKYQDLFSAYRTGLRGQNYSMPSAVAEPLGEQRREFVSAHEALIEERINGRGQFRYSRLVERAELPPALAQALTQALPGTQIIDSAIKKKDRGGSSEQERFWVFVQREPGASPARQIIELKEIASPALARVTRQAREPVRTQRVIDFLLAGERDPLFQVISANSKHYLLRLKFSGVIDVPYSADSNDEIETIEQLGLYGAFYLGTLHRRSLGWSTLVPPRDRTRNTSHPLLSLQETDWEQTKDCVKEYLDLLEAAHSNR